MKSERFQWAPNGKKTVVRESPRVKSHTSGAITVVELLPPKCHTSGKMTASPPCLSSCVRHQVRMTGMVKLVLCSTSLRLRTNSGKRAVVRDSWKRLTSKNSGRPMVVVDSTL